MLCKIAVDECKSVALLQGSDIIVTEVTILYVIRMGIINYKCVTTFENAMTVSLFFIIDLCTYETQNENF